MERRWTDTEGRSWIVRSDGDALVFDGGGRTRTVPTGRAADLESLDDDELRDMFESVAPEEERPSGGPGSPSAVGRESAPHVDPADFDPEA